MACLTNDHFHAQEKQGKMKSVRADDFVTVCRVETAREVSDDTLRRFVVIVPQSRGGVACVVTRA